MTPAQDLDDPFNFVLPADHRVELSLPGQLGEVAAEAVEGGSLALTPLGRAAAADRPLAGLRGFHAVAQQIQNFLTHVLEFESQIHQHLRGNAFLLAQKAQQNVLGADVVVS